jgi:cytoskeletal protein CcmA (bactofilin family)
MFRKPSEEEAPPAAKPPSVGEPSTVRTRSVSVIGPTLVFKGELSADEDLVIQGTIEGTIAHHKKNLTIGPKGRVSADIHASSVLVEGQLEGDIHSDGLVSLAKGATVNGNIYCSRLVLQDGARFNGKIEMAKQSQLKIAPKPEAVDNGPAEVENRSA